MATAMENRCFLLALEHASTSSALCVRRSGAGKATVSSFPAQSNDVHSHVKLSFLQALGHVRTSYALRGRHSGAGKSSVSRALAQSMLGLPPPGHERQ